VAAGASHAARGVEHGIHYGGDGVNVGLEGDVKADEELVGLEAAGLRHELVLVEFPVFGNWVGWPRKPEWGSGISPTIAKGHVNGATRRQD